METRLNRGQIRSLQSPVRLALVGALRALGASSVRELAGHIGRRPDALYYHMRHLEEQKIVSPRETRRAGKRDETIYELTADKFTVEPNWSDPEFRADWIRSVKTAMRFTLRQYEATLELFPKSDLYTEKSLYGMVNARLTEQSAKNLHEQLNDLLDAALKDEGPAGRRMVFFSILTPAAKPNILPASSHE